MSEASDTQSAARTFGLDLQVLSASSERDFGGVFAALGQSRTGGFVIGGDALFTSQEERLCALAARRRFTQGANSRWREVWRAIARDLADAYHLAGIYTGKVRKGEKLSDLPVQQASRPPTRSASAC